MDISSTICVRESAWFMCNLAVCLSLVRLHCTGHPEPTLTEDAIKAIADKVERKLKDRIQWMGRTCPTWCHIDGTSKSIG
jgi:hypothetical protein